MKRPKLTPYEWFMAITKVLGVCSAVFLYGEHQLNAVSKKAEKLIADEHQERREDFKALDNKVSKIYEIMIRWDREDHEDQDGP